MVTRRDALQLAGSALLGSLAGCSGGADAPEQTGTPTSTSPPSTAPTSTPEETPTSTEDTSTPEELDEWEPAWRRTVPENHALGLDVFDGSLYATLSNDRGGPSAVVDVDPSDGSARWRTTFEGETEHGSDAGYRATVRSGWGVTLTDDHVYSVHGRYNDWTALDALDRATGKRLWSLRRERRLAVHGVTSDVVIATGREFFQPETTHDTPEEPLVSALYGIDVDTGEVRWRDEFAGVIDVAVGDDAAYVAAGSRLVAVGLDGERRWTVESDREARTARVAGERVYYVAGGGDISSVYGLNRSGDREWSQNLAIDEVLLDGDRLYAAGTVTLALDLDGSVVWRDDAHGSSLLLDDRRETLYTRSGGQRTRAYDLPGGDELWSFAPEEKYGWPLAATAETAVVEGYAPDRALYAVDRGGGEAYKRYDVGDRTPFGAASIDGRVFVGIDDVLFGFDP